MHLKLKVMNEVEREYVDELEVERQILCARKDVHEHVDEIDPWNVQSDQSDGSIHNPMVFFLSHNKTSGLGQYFMALLLPFPSSFSWAYLFYNFHDVHPFLKSMKIP